MRGGMRGGRGGMKRGRDVFVLYTTALARAFFPRRAPPHARYVRLPFSCPAPAFETLSKH